MSCQFDKHAFGLALYLDFIAVGANTILSNAPWIMPSAHFTVL